MYIIVLITTKDKVQAKKIAKALIEAKLIACANIIDGVESLFVWEGRFQSAKEALLILKTKKSHFKKLELKIKSLHSYTTPEIIALPITEGAKDYLKWINEVVC